MPDACHHLQQQREAVWAPCHICKSRFVCLFVFSASHNKVSRQLDITRPMSTRTRITTPCVNINANTNSLSTFRGKIMFFKQRVTLHSRCIFLESECSVLRSPYCSTPFLLQSCIILTSVFLVYFSTRPYLPQ